MPNNVDWTIVTAAIVKALQAILAALVLTNAVSLSGEQLGGVILAVEAVLGIPLSYLAAKRTVPTVPVPPVVPPAPAGG